MLVLGRKPFESLMIGDGITITVLTVERNQVRIGIVAPRVVSVPRADLLVREGLQNTHDPAPRNEGAGRFGV